MVNKTQFLEYKLIQLVKENPILYDKNISGYRNNAMKQKVWDNISVKLGIKVPTLKVKWKSLRDRYSRELKINPDMIYVNPALSKTGWELMQELSFLGSFISFRHKNDSQLNTTVNDTSLIESNTSDTNNDETPKDAVETVNLKMEFDENIFSTPVTYEPATPASLSPWNTPTHSITSMSSPEPSQSEPPAKQKNSDVDEHSLLEKLMEKINSLEANVMSVHETADQAFGAFVAAELSRLPDPIRRQIRLKIVSLLNDAYLQI